MQIDQAPSGPIDPDAPHNGYPQSISMILPYVGPGDTILVHEDWYSVYWSVTGKAPADGSDPLLTTYVGDLVYPAGDVTIKAAPFFPNAGKVIEIQGTGASSVVTFPTVLSTRSSLLEGFTITGGVGGTDDYISPDSGTIRVGGGIRCLGATPTIRSCTIEVNSAVLGGGVYASRGIELGDSLSGPLIEDCKIMSNVAVGSTQNLGPDGGGVYAIHCSPEIRSTAILNNTAGASGGGVALYNELLFDPNPAGVPFFYGPSGAIHPVIEDCDITDNRAYGLGGGVFAFVRVNALIQRCSILSNTVLNPTAGGGSGGGFYWENCTMEITTCDIRGNSAGQSGGGLQIDGEGAAGVNASSITHCTIARNVTTDPGVGSTGGGVACSTSPETYTGMTQFENCLIVNNEAGSGGGVHIVEASASFQNCTISQNKAHDTSSEGFSGGVYYLQAGAWTGIWFQDTIIDGNLYTQLGLPVRAWDVDFMDVLLGGSSPKPSITWCIMSKARQYPLFTNSPGNLVALPLFASGPALTHFPVNRFYLSHTPEQGATSRAYNAGSTMINAMLAVDGMRCRTPLTSLLTDVGVVDIGFHYPNYPLVGQP